LKTTTPYPLIEHANNLHAASGRSINEITLDAAVAGELSPADLQVNAETLQAQATVAREAGFVQLAENLERAAELTRVPNDELLSIYALLRPGRATYDELQALAERFAGTYAAPRNAAWVLEAAEVYRRRNLLRRS
jgi:propanediol dehydratase small subunit